MTEHPIIFTGEMVRAILDGRKTQTRRVAKIPDHWGIPPAVLQDGVLYRWGPGIYARGDKSEFVRCRYGKPGDGLWVREAWGLFDTEPSDGSDGATVFYRATDGDRHDLRYQKWRPSIHMPRWASRITLRVTNVRVERVQDISIGDAIAELGGRAGGIVNERGHFMERWDNINAGRRYSWESNPWVWVVEFERLTRKRVAG